jgi:hypothetical protein
LDSTAYISTDKALTEGGYEPSATNIGEGSESLLKNAAQALLGNTQPVGN